MAFCIVSRPPQPDLIVTDAVEDYRRHDTQCGRRSIPGFLEHVLPVVVDRQTSGHCALCSLFQLPSLSLP